MMKITPENLRETSFEMHAPVMKEGGDCKVLRWHRTRGLQYMHEVGSSADSVHWQVLSKARPAEMNIFRKEM